MIVVGGSIPLEVLDLVERIQERAPGAEQVETVLEGMRAMLGGDVAGINSVDFRSGASASRSSCDATGSQLERLCLDVGSLLAHQPLARHYAETGDRQPRRMSDLVSSREWDRLRPAMSELHGPSGARHILVLPLSQPREVGVTAAVARFDGADFSDRDVRCAAALQPALMMLRLAEPALKEREPSSTDPASPSALTVREGEVLRWLGQGLTAESIARRLGVRPKTVRKHLQHIYAKLGCDNRLSAVLTATGQQLLD